MSTTVVTPAMNSTIASIDTNAAAYAPAVIASIQAAEAFAPTGTTGAQKFSAVMAGLGAGSAALESSPNQNVAGIAALVNLGVMIANLLGAFRHSKSGV